MKKGDHLVTQRFGYTHHGIYLGNQEVVHYSGFADGMNSGAIEITSYSAFTGGNSCWVKTHLIRTYDAQETIERAMSRLGEDWYNVLLNNCEHFVNWCIMGLHSSRQVNNLIAGVVQSQVLLNPVTATRALATIGAMTTTVTTTASTTATTVGLVSAIGGGAAYSAAAGGSTMGVAALTGGVALGTVGAPVVAAAAVCGLIGAAVWSIFD